jgi:hypothetical protein
MSAVIVVTPLVVAGWPVISAAVTAAVSSMGFSLLSAADNVGRRNEARTRAEIDIEDSEVIDAAGGLEQELVVERDGVRAVFSRDERGALRLCLDGAGMSKAQLRALGEELIGRVTQQFVYHKLMTELKERNLHVVEEEMSEDRTIRIRVRNL